jgi:hypothetical protein
MFWCFSFFLKEPLRNILNKNDSRWPLPVKPTAISHHSDVAPSLVIDKSVFPDDDRFFFAKATALDAGRRTSDRDNKRA